MMVEAHMGIEQQTLGIEVAGCWFHFVYMIVQPLDHPRDSKNQSGQLKAITPWNIEPGEFWMILGSPLVGKRRKAPCFGRAFHIPNEVDCVKGLVLWWLKMKE